MAVDVRETSKLLIHNNNTKKTNIPDTMHDPWLGDIKPLFKARKLI